MICHCSPNFIPPSLRRTKFSSKGSYKNLAVIRSGTSVLEISNLVKNPISINLASIRARYLPIQLLFPAEKGIKEYGSELYRVLSFQRSGSNF